MEGLIKNKVFLFSVILNVALFVFAIASGRETQKERVLHDNDIRDRLNAEEQVEKFKKEIQVFEERSESIRKQLEEERASHELTKKALLHEQLVGKAVREELNKVTKTGDKP